MDAIKLASIEGVSLACLLIAVLQVCLLSSRGSDTLAISSQGSLSSQELAPPKLEADIYHFAEKPVSGCFDWESPIETRQALPRFDIVAAYRLDEKAMPSAPLPAFRARAAAYNRCVTDW